MVLGKVKQRVIREIIILEQIYICNLHSMIGSNI